MCFRFSGLRQISLILELKHLNKGVSHPGFSSTACYFKSDSVSVFSYRLIADKNSILQLREEHGVTHKRSFPGCQLIDYLIQNGEADSRRQGLELCRALQEHGIIQHGEGSFHLPFDVQLSTVGLPLGTLAIKSKNTHCIDTIYTKTAAFCSLPNSRSGTKA